jgi:hypothetical protein
MDFDKAEAIQQAQLALLRKKNADYGDHNITLTGLAGVVTRMSDKMERLRKLALEGHEPNFESIEDTLDDMSLYGVIGRLVLADGIVAHPTLVYLGGPIGSLSEEERTLWRLRSRRIFQYYGVGCFDPAGALHPQPAVNRPRVSAINDAAMRACDVCLFNLERGRGFGSAREVERAVQWGKRVVIISEELYDTTYTHDVEVVLSELDAWETILGQSIEDPDWILAGCPSGHDTAASEQRYLASLDEDPHELDSDEEGTSPKPDDEPLPPDPLEAGWVPTGWRKLTRAERDERQAEMSNRLERLRDSEFPVHSPKQPPAPIKPDRLRHG